MENTFMMVIDHVGDEEAMVYAQLGQCSLLRVSCAHHTRDVTGTETGDALLFERAAS